MRPDEALATALVILAAILAASFTGFGWAIRRQVGRNDQLLTAISALTVQITELRVGGSTPTHSIRADLDALEARHSLLAVSTAEFGARFNSLERWVRDEFTHPGRATPAV